jgi:hypothetical protein
LSLGILEEEEGREDLEFSIYFLSTFSLLSSTLPLFIFLSLFSTLNRVKMSIKMNRAKNIPLWERAKSESAKWNRVDGKIVTSEGHRQGTQLWERVLLMIHEPIRFDLVMMLRMVSEKNMDPEKTPLKIPLFFHWYHSYFYPFLHHILEMREKILIPAFTSKGYLPLSTSESQIILLEILRKIGYCEFRFDLRQPNQPSNQYVMLELRKAILEMYDHLISTFSKDESELIELLRLHFNQKEQYGILKKIIKSSASKSPKFFAPWLYCGTLRWWGSDGAIQMYKSMSLAQRIVFSKFHLPEYKKKVTQLVDAILLDCGKF